ncbi:MAG: TonB-dependent receptor [Kofleriaceae bacterium]
MKRLAVIFVVLTSVPAAADAPKGAIKGTVIYEGAQPERKKLRRDTDPYCAKTDKLAEDVVVTKGKLKDVLVRIKNGTGGKHPAPATPVLIDQHECMYSPRVVGLVAGQKLAVRNSDGTFHNVRGTVAGKLLWNKPQPASDPDLALDPAGKPGDVVDVVCDVHPWMHSYAVVMDHPFFAVTGEDGAFEIKGLAAGSYTLETWHPTLGVQTLTVKIGTGAKAVVPARISYKGER